MLLASDPRVRTLIKRLFNLNGYLNCGESIFAARPLSRSSLRVLAKSGAQAGALSVGNLCRAGIQGIPARLEWRKKKRCQRGCVTPSTQAGAPDRVYWDR
jgi:hypothetical protein